MAFGMLTAYFGGGLFCGILFAAAAVSVIYFAVKRSRSAICAVGLLWGIAVMMGHLELYCKPITEFGGKTVRAEFVVNETSMISGGTKEYTVEMNLAGRKTFVRITDREKLEVGDVATAVVELNEPDSDDMLQNLADGVLLLGEISELIAVKSGGAGISSVIRVLRARMVEMVSGNIFGNGGELALAMLLGEDSALSPVMREKLKICGASHYTAVSGSHFTLFAAVLLGALPEKRRHVKQAVSLLFAPAAVIFFRAVAVSAPRVRNVSAVQSRADILPKGGYAQLALHCDSAYRHVFARYDTRHGLRNVGVRRIRRGCCRDGGLEKAVYAAAR